jgi:hypothetical protein
MFPEEDIECDESKASDDFACESVKLAAQRIASGHGNMSTINASLWEGEWRVVCGVCSVDKIG